MAAGVPILQYSCNYPVCTWIPLTLVLPPQSMASELAAVELAHIKFLQAKLNSSLTVPMPQVRSSDPDPLTLTLTLTLTLILTLAPTAT